MRNKLIIIDGNQLVSIPIFYQIADQLFTHDLDFEVGHNLDAFDDLLVGGFGVFEPEESISIVWKNIEASKKYLGNQFVHIVLEIIQQHSHIYLVIEN